jgi:hypothetical protein
MKEPLAASHLAREADPMTASTLWAVQCGCADYAANIVTIETTSPEEACVRAIEEANASDGWKRLDDSGLTFVRALAPGDVNNPWSREPTAPSFPCRTNTPKTLRSASQPTGALPSSSALPVTPAAPTVAKRASSTGSIPTTA